MFKRLISILLMLCMTAAVFISCAKPDDNKEEVTSSEQATNAETEEDTWTYDNLENEDFGKREFKILTNNELDVGVIGDGDTSENDALDDAIWRRNNYVQDRFNIVLSSTQQDYTGVSARVKGLKKSGDLEYSVIFNHMVSSASLASTGDLFNLNLIEELDMTAPWWDKDVKTGFQVEGVLYLTAGDILPSTMLHTSCMAFNKTMMDRSTELNQDGSKKLVYPYELARNGEWTLDVLANMTKDFSKDLGSDGKYDKDEDVFGMTSWHLASPYNFFYGSGCTMIKNNGTDVPVFEYDAEYIQKVYDKVYEIFITNNSLYVKNESEYEDVFEVFSQGRALFNCCTLSKMHGADSAFKRMTDDYGVLPQPKYDSTGEYLSFINGSSSMLGVVNVLEEGSEDSHFIGTVIEGIANASYNMVTYTLYEVTAKAKNVNDQDSADMVDIIIRHKVFDFGYAHFFERGYSCATLFQKMLDAKADSVSTYTKKDDGSTKKALEKLLSKNYGK